MEAEILFGGKLKLSDISCTETGYWQLSFNGTVNLGTFCFWRFKREKEVLYISLDHNERFGRRSPLNLVEELKNIFKKNDLIEIQRDINTGDLFFSFEDNYCFEFFTSSMGYENWSLYINGKQYISMGGGELA